MISMSSPSGATMDISELPGGGRRIEIRGLIKIDLSPDWVVALREALEPSTICPAGASCYLLDHDEGP